MCLRSSARSVGIGDVICGQHGGKSIPQIDMSGDDIESQTAPLIVPRNDVTLGTKIMRSVTFGALRYVLLAPIPFLLTPFILRKIGVAGYGTWAVFLAINSLTSLADLGLVGTLSKFVAEYHAHKDFVALSRLLSSAIALFLVIGLAVGAFVGGATHFVTKLFFHGSYVSQQELSFLIRCFLVVIVANLLTLLLSSVTSGLQRLDLTYAMSAGNIILSAAGSGLLLSAGWGLRGLVCSYATSAVLTVIGYFLLIKKLLPAVTLNPFHFELQEARKMFGFSLRLYVIQATVAIQNQLDKIFLALIIGVAPVGWFDIASDVALKVRAVIGLILAPVLPAASELDALRDEPRTKELYYRTHKYLALFGIPVVVCCDTYSRRFVELWLGKSMALIAVPMSVLITVSFFNLASGPGFLIFAGRGYLRPAIQSSILGITLSIVLSLGLIYRYGFAGAAFGTSASVLIAALYLIWVFHHESGYSFGRLIAEGYLKPSLCALFSIGVILLTHPVKATSWIRLFAVSSMFGAIYVVVILLSHFLDDYDWSKIEAFMPVMRHARKFGLLA